ncbi:MAG: hypothetical protein AMQ74_01694 [Candidatus Methanofastidiosum methylothiophilum]|uniref:Uncharacterized protein n=1 Tax=Candidatus Methanofastidiosum methylothiophilum TaxID=1705564 RepID=A0A150IQT3_9EURY|nr:MAG: hypothetical protein AMQ74_01694 [Candidatus Methanofastidiosum methylthiophilus]
MKKEIRVLNQLGESITYTDHKNYYETLKGKSRILKMELIFEDGFVWGDTWKPFIFCDKTFSVRRG